LAAWAQDVAAASLPQFARASHRAIAHAVGTALTGLAAREPEAVRHALHGVSLVQPGAAGLVGLVVTLGGKDVLHRLQEAVAADDPEARRAAVQGLARLSDPNAAQLLAFSLADDDVEVQLAAATALGRFRDANGQAFAIDPLLHALRDAAAPVQVAAATALGETGDPRAIEPLKELAMHAEPCVVNAALHSLRTLKAQGLQQWLLSLLSHVDQEIVKEALGALAEAEPTLAAAAMLQALDHPIWDVRLTAVQLLERAQLPVASAVLHEHIAHEKDDLVRAALAQVLKAAEA
jgi:HEAT repeat protein